MTKFLIDYDKHENLDPALDMLDQLAERGKVRSVYGRIVEVDDGLADGLLVVLQAMGLQPEIFPTAGLDAHAELMASADQPPEQSAAQETTNQERDTWPVCPYCGERYWPRRKDQTICGKAECKKAKQREYAKAHAAKKSQAEGPAIEEERAAVADPFAGIPEVSAEGHAILWMVEGDPSRIMTMAQLQVSLESQSLKPGTRLHRRDSGTMYEVFEGRPGALGVCELETTR